MRSALLGRLSSDRRVELVATDSLTAEWVSFAERVAAVVVVTASEPLSALGYVVTAGVRAPIIVAAKARYRDEAADVLAAGAAGFLELPPTTSDMDRFVDQFSQHASASFVDPTLRLLLDPIARVARYRDRTVALTQRQFAILHCLSTRNGMPVAAEELYRHVWGEAATAQSQSILAVYVFQLRKKLTEVGLNDALKTIRGFGYALMRSVQR